MINSERLRKRIYELSQIGKIGETGVRRLTLSKEDREAVELVEGWMKEAGLETRIDNFANLIGYYEGSDPSLPVLMVGSHIDSQPYGGRFDGVVGVLGALEAVQTMIENKIVPRQTIEVVAFCDEEGCRFNKGLFGVRGILGKLEPDELERKDENGVTRKEALIAFGCDITKFKESEYEPGSIGTFIEMHIEQGPVLESQDQPIGIVTGISGPLWLTVQLKGFAGHAGSVPMGLRKDALLGASKIVTALNEIVRQEPDAPTVGTVGNITVFPNSRNIIPEVVTFTIDLRDIDLERRDRYEKELRETIDKVALEHGLKALISEDTNSEPRYCAEEIKQVMHEESRNMGLSTPELMSGPFHDALAMSYACPYGMIFVRCEDGISHNPKEFAAHEDIAAGTELLYRTVLRLSN
jgi:allantoate deiminase